MFQIEEEEKSRPRNMTETDKNSQLLQPPTAKPQQRASIVGPGTRQTSWGEDIELKSQFSMQEIKGDEEKEVYLILMVHGIGSNLDS